ncbi:MAG: hypothetical protein EHM72_11720, partial [Calditrichaeota bacterium]
MAKMMWARVIFSFILLQASALFPADNNDSHTAEFYQQLCGFDSFSPARIDFLKSFITVHPSFLTAYEFLFEAFVQINQLDAADAYFSRLEKAGNPAGASWMLARLAVFQGDLNKADKLYRLALSSDISNHSPALDYLAFDAKNNNAFHTAEYLQSLDLPPTDLIFYRACSKYNRGEYQSADSLFGGLGLTIDDLQRWHYQGLADYYQSQLVQADSLFRIGLRRAQEMQDIYHQALFSYNLAYTAKTEPERVIAQARRLAESIDAVQLLN